MLLTLILIAPVLAFTQSRDTVFRVKAVSADVRITPEKNELYKYLTAKFRILKSASAKIDTIIFTNGKCEYTDSTLRIKPAKYGTALLKIYTSLTGKKSTLSLVKEFNVVGKALLRPNLDGVVNDSAIHQLKAVAMGRLHLEQIGVYDGPEYPVISFEMTMIKNGTIDTLRANGNRMSYEMRDRVDNMPDGGMMQFNNIKYVTEGDTLVAPPLRVYLRRDDIKKF
ncbi:MAG: hypothetical protein JWO06_580 [Bacteroidota bacterium]|nr:hypothetical protein [Bacteroidota bacterium]